MSLLTKLTRLIKVPIMIQELNNRIIIEEIQ